MQGWARRQTTTKTARTTKTTKITTRMRAQGERLDSILLPHGLQNYQGERANGFSFEMEAIDWSRPSTIRAQSTLTLLSLNAV